MFVPSGWYHQVTNLTTTISINHNWFNGFNLHHVWAFLQNEIKAIEHELNHLKCPLGSWTDAEFRSECQKLLQLNSRMNYTELFTLLKAKEHQLEAESVHSAPYGKAHMIKVHANHTSRNKVSQKIAS